MPLHPNTRERVPLSTTNTSQDLNLAGPKGIGCIPAPVLFCSRGTPGQEPATRRRISFGKYIATVCEKSGRRIQAEYQAARYHRPGVNQTRRTGTHTLTEPLEGSCITCTAFLPSDHMTIAGSTSFKALKCQDVARWTQFQFKVVIILHVTEAQVLPSLHRWAVLRHQ